MANKLKMAQAQAIEALRSQGWSCRRIARELGIHRDTVRKYVQELDTFGSKPANVTAGNPSNSAPGEGSKPATVTAGKEAGKSLCFPHHENILLKLELGLSAQRIFQDLASENDFQGSYESVKRYARKIGGTSPLPFRRMECMPGEESQVDFGKGAPVKTLEGRSKRPWLYRIVLCHSRKGYSEVVWRQSTESFIRCLENAFRHFGGSTKVVIIDNLKAAVTEADWYDPEINPKIQEFARHYGIVFLPTKPYTPRHKGKIERGVGYAQENGLKGKVFQGLAEQNEYLLSWEKNVADLRIHGTTRRQVRKQFEEIERPALLALPPDSFPFFHEGRRRVHRDGHVEVEKAYYSVPPEYLGRDVWARWDMRLVKILDGSLKQIAIHVRIEPGRFSTQDAHISSKKISGVERGAGYLLGKIRFIGSKTALWAKSVIEERGIQGVRVLQGLLSLTGKHSSRDIENACDLALTHGSYRLKTIRELLKRPTAQENFTFMEKHPLIRDLEDYGKYVQVKF